MGFESEQYRSEIADLETRNRELAALLAQHAQANEQLNIQNEQIVRFMLILLLVRYDLLPSNQCK